MLKHFLTFILLSAFSWGLMGQCADLFATSQSAVDAWVDANPSCTEIETVVLGFQGSTNDISDISGLSNITNITNNIQIIGTSLTSLTGLENLVSVTAGVSTGTIFIEENSMLTDISAIANVTTVGSIDIIDNPLLSDCSIDIVCTLISDDPINNVTITGNAMGCASTTQVEDACTPALTCPVGDVFLFAQEQVDSFAILYPTCTTIDGNLVIGDEFGASDITDLSALSGVTTINGGCYFYNTQLTNFAGIGNVSTLSGECVIVGNSLITNLNGLGAPPGFSITNLTITDNALLTEITAFSSLTSISGDLTISNNASLTSFNGLQGLTSIGGGCFYYNNTSLTSIAELSSLTSVGGALEIVGNTSLADCATDSVCDAVDGGGSIVISGNATGCASLAEVQAACSGDICPPAGDLVLATQADVDAFVADFPDCTEVNGNLIIGVQGGSSDVSDISGLSGITAVYGGCYFYNTQLTSFNGVGSITTVQGECVIVGNNLITNLNGLGAPPGFAITNLTITDNALLTEITAFSMLTSISGNLRIERNGSLTSFSGLENLTTIGGGCYFYNNTSLTTFSALSNVTSVNGVLEIGGNTSITSLAGLEGGIGTNITTLRIVGNTSLTTIGALSGLTSISGDLVIGGNTALNLFTGLDNLATIGGGCEFYGNGNANFIGLSAVTAVNGVCLIYDNLQLTSLTGLGTGSGINITDLQITGNPLLTDVTVFSGLTSISGRFEFGNNTSATSLMGFGSLTTIGGACLIYGNTSLTSIEALSGVTSAGGEVRIENNTQLAECAITSVCNAIAGTTMVTISGNAAGCADLPEVEVACGLAGPDCPEGDVNLSSQAEVDAFVANFPACTSIMGNLVIGFFDAQITGEESDITDISGLSNITSVSGNLVLEGNPLLGSFTGMDNITSVGGGVVFRLNPLVTNLDPFSNFNDWGGSIFVIDRMDNLTSIDGIVNVVLVPSNLVFIVANPMLSQCAIDNVCTYVSSMPPTFDISSNAPGCASIAEIDAICNPVVNCPAGNVVLPSQAAVDFYVANFPNCTTINGNLSIGDGSGSNDITDITGLSNITTVTGNLIIANTALTTLTGINNITTVGGNFLVETNVNLTSLQAMSSLTSINGFFRVENNNSLTSLTGAGNFTGINLVVIINNPVLSVCHIQNVCDYLEIPDNLATIANNAVGCADRDTVETACEFGVPGDCPVDLYFMSQAEVDQFAIDHPDCTEITGNIQIGCGIIPTDIFDLTPLSNIIAVGGKVALFLNPDLESMDGLDNIVTIGGNLGLWVNNGLTSMAGLESLTTIGGGLNLHANNFMTSLSGLDNLSSIGGRMDVEEMFLLADFTGLGSLTSIGGFAGISNNPSLTSLSGLDALTSIGLMLNIENNAFLANVDGLGSLASVGFDMIIEGNMSLTNLSGFSSLTSVGRNLAFINNDALTDLTGMSSVSSINGFLVIRSNDNLSTLNGLENIDEGGISQLYIIGNANLSGCAIDNICAYLATPGSVTSIFKNTGECVGRAVLENACSDGLLDSDASGSLIADQTGIEALKINTSAATGIELYPNPTNGILQLRNVEAQQVIVFNPQGQRVAQFNDPGNDLDISTLSAGVYYLNFTTAEGNYTKRVVKID